MPPSILYRYESILNAASITDLFYAVERATEEMGVSAFHYGAHAPHRVDGNKPRFLFDGIDCSSLHSLTNFPDSWGDRYRSQRYLEVDPLVRHCSLSNRPIMWHDRQQPDTKRVALLFDEARQHGLAAGMVLSTHGSKNEHSIFSLSLDNTLPRNLRNLERQVGSAYLLLVHMHEAVRRLAFPKEPAPIEGCLTARERESLLWVIDGKTSWEIAQIFGISENTVIFHINNAKRKLDASSRTQAAAKALSLGLITP